MFLVVSGNEPKIDFEIFLNNYAWIICVAVVVVILAVIAFILIRGRNKKGKKKIISKASNDEWINALGGKENIVDIASTGSRLVIKINNKDLVNRDELTRLGVNNIVMMSDKITLVTNLDNEKIVDNIKSSL